MYFPEYREAVTADRSFHKLFKKFRARFFLSRFIYKEEKSRAESVYRKRFGRNQE